MTEDEKTGKNRETKAGLMDKNGGADKDGKHKAKSEETTGNTPKVGKDKAGNHNGEPLH